MKKQLLYSWLLAMLFCITGASNAWGESVKYAVSSRTSVSVDSGTAPTGSSASFSSTYSGTAQQMTGGNSHTLTLTGYNGYKITNITLSMKSNKSAGAGKLSYSVDGGSNFTYLVGTSGSGVAFNNASWYGSWSQSYVDISKSVDITASSSNIVIKIEATANSIFCASYTITYESVATSAVATTTTIDATDITNTDVYVSTTAGAFAATVKDNEDATIAAAAVTWSSSNTDVATIDPSTGAVTLVAAGTTTITASYAGVTDTYQASSDTYELTVTSSAPYVQPTSVTFNMNYVWLGSSNGSNLSSSALPVEKSQDNVTVTITNGTSTCPRGDSDYIRVYKGSTITFEAPSGYDITGITFTTGGNNTWNEPSVDSGTLSEKTWSGSASSVEFSLSGSCFISSAEVTLTKQKTLSSIAVSGTYPTVFEVGDAFSHEGAVVTATYDDASNAVVTGSATFSTPDMTSAGAKTITVSYTENAVEKTTTYDITVKTPATLESIDLSGTYPTTFNVGDEFSHEGMTVTANFNDLSSADVTASATFTGYDMSAAGVQTVTVSYTHKDVTTKTATYDITVNTVAVTGVSVDATASVNVGETTTLTATVSPSNATNKNVTWESDDEDVATVDENGVVTGVAAGTATITVTSAADNTKTASCTVTVSVVPGTAARPYTVAQALEVIDALADNGTIADKYVTGKISQIDSYNSTYHSITYWISDDGTTTSQMEVYSGKGLNGANFSAMTDLNVGDVITVHGELKKYVKNSTTTPEFNSNSQIVARTELPASDLTKTGDITLDFKNGNTDADLTEYFTTSSTGAITYTVADETVIERADELISALKVGTTTVTVSQAASLNYKAGEITINVTVQDTREAATTIPAINISTLKVSNSGTVSVTNPVKADEGVTFSYASSNDDVLLIVDDEYEAVAVGTATITVTATPNNTNLYKSVVANFEVTVEADVKTDTEITLDEESGSTIYGTPKSVGFVITDGYDGTMGYTIDNAAIADVVIGADAITFTPKAVGTAVFTFSAPATATCEAADDVTYTITVNAPTGGTKAAESGFVKVTATEDITGGEYLIVYEDGNLAFDGSSDGLDAVGNTIEVGIENNKIAADATTTASTFTIAAVTGGYSIQSKSGYYIGQTSDANGLATSDETAYTNTLSITDDGDADIVSSSAYLRYNSASNQTRFRYYKSSSYTGQKAIQLYKLAGADITVTLNAYGYATFCSQYPLDFSDAEGYTAWEVTGTSGTTITFSKIKGKVKGGTGILLKGEAGAIVTLKSADSDNTLSSNMLVGTTAPTYVTTVNGDYTNFGLSGDKFKKINTGVVRVNKAYLPILTANVPNAEARLTFIFEDEETTGIESLTPALSNSEGAQAVYDLQGRKVQNPKRGMYIINGKKVVIK